MTHEKTLLYLMLHFVEKQVFSNAPKRVYLMLYYVEKQVFL